MNYRRNNRGFTLAELLIVIAIIAVLVAVAIPVFSSSLEKSKEATDIANIRSAYASVSVNGVTGEDSELSQTVPLVQAEDGWQNEQYAEALESLGDVEGGPTEGGSCEVSWAEDGKVLFSFDGVRVSFPKNYSNERNDRSDFGKSYAELCDRYIQNGTISSIVLSRGETTVNGHKIISIYSRDNEALKDILPQMAADKYDQASIDAVNSSVQCTAYFDEDNNLIAYSYDYFVKGVGYRDMMDKDGKYIEEKYPPNKYDYFGSKRLIADYYWPQS